MSKNDNANFVRDNMKLVTYNAMVYLKGEYKRNFHCKCRANVFS